MTQDEILKKLTPVFHDVFDDESITPTSEMTAGDVDEWDSLSHIRLIVAIEKAFNIKFSAAEIGSLKNVGDIVELIKSK